MIPISRMQYRYDVTPDNVTTVSLVTNIRGVKTDGWDDSDFREDVHRKECGLAYFGRIKVPVGETFQLMSLDFHGFGNRQKEYPVKRISENTVIFRGRIISSDKSELIKNQSSNYTPVYVDVRL